MRALFIYILFTQNAYNIFVIMTKKLYKIFAVPLFQDNYSYVIQNLRSRELALIDPANPQVIMDFLQKNFHNPQVSNVLYTHKHWDHAGGSQQLKKDLKNQHLKVYIGLNDKESVLAANTFLQGKQANFEIGKCFIKAYFVPCHTRGHYIYHFTPKNAQEVQKQKNQIQSVQVESKQAKSQNIYTIQGKKVRVFQADECAFTGDTIFSGGVGRFFQGNAQQMVQNIQMISDKVGQNVSIFNGHQYTLSNLKWAVKVDKQNQKLQTYYQSLISKIKPSNEAALGSVQQQQTQLIQQSQLCTLPTTLQREKQINLFIRAVLLSNTWLHTTMSEDKTKLMSILRSMKNKGITQFSQLEA